MDNLHYRRMLPRQPKIREFYIRESYLGIRLFEAVFFDQKVISYGHRLEVNCPLVREMLFRWCWGHSRAVIKIVRLVRLWQKLLQNASFQCTLSERTNVLVTGEGGFTMQTYAEYTKQAIIDTVAELTSVPLLEYINAMLMAALAAEKRREGD